MLRRALPRQSCFTKRTLALCHQARQASNASFQDPSATNTLDRANSSHYTAPLAKTVRNIKLFSLSSLTLSTLISPVFFVIESDLDVSVRAAMVGVAILTSGVSTAVVAWVLKPYVVAARVLGERAGWRAGTRVPEGLEEEALPMTMDQQDALVTGATPPPVSSASTATSTGKSEEMLLTMDEQDILTTSGIREKSTTAPQQQVEMTRLTLLGQRTTSIVDAGSLIRDRNGRMFANLKTQGGQDWFYVHETTGFWQTLAKNSRSVDEGQV
ncbi:hypothetical protein BCR37DRAFT_390777 [Protomyces lactucae-debilis]|uniref:Transmembrane protein n=1 Tax=Protomyces lactucae-debilis TaxID=2754530 RepID=A0A1Y2FUU9_PROLT|nr:uncharacterized protein BCR37DRAFT_390777 [Protomyces lactucae-debilis]ORY87064.1 hypothetical protein BCR37DRAFT_390777 [Protomyces lactucae-debilis]